ncbi:FMN-dependent dehydrogenase-domain-containing protein [Plectosphaerella plurivora]|uniref:L-lactate dehydrogenase (cytochrome) n=1 Tax=Plectosphaerella plurivora TaxID=936078 RepID=A0A9P9ADZ7_9PEZI|nr:FMN-dependent dehydrogenase-domain-containing protein [Plectosphaerella plurivora]
MVATSLKDSEVAEHDSPESCWVIIHGKVYDMTDFLPDHPGGEQSILKHAGKDATAAYDPIHPAGILDKFLDPSKHLGPVSLDPRRRDETQYPPQPADKPPLSHCLNLFDFEAVARQVLNPTSWAYFSSAADDEITLQENHRAFHRVWFRPRVLNNVKQVDTSTTLLGTKSALPFYISATAMNKLAHPDGELAFTRAAGTHDIIQMIPTMSSYSLDEIVDARRDESQPQWMQLYVNEDREVTKEIVEQAEKRGCKGLFITVDNPQVGRREKDMRARQLEASRNGEEWHAEVYQGTSTFLDSTLSWDDIPWFKSITNMPIVLKGIQSAEDVLKAVEYGVAGVVLSNHGGRQLEFARSSLEILAETMPVLRERGLQDKIEVFVDGGVRRGTDVIKALCLGARGVGIGRGLLYPLGAYGQEGVERAIELLRGEIERGLRLLGVKSVGELHAGLITTDSLAKHSGYHVDGPAEATYEALQVVAPGGKSKL